MRNRYYDPATGQFTQQDPIGLAGGLNAYGFAAGDPVSYSDPYGLCPESMIRPDGFCPGGLDIGQWNAVQEGAETLAPGERQTIINDLYAGMYSAADLGTDRAAETRWSWSGNDDRVVLNSNPDPNSNFFGMRAGDRGFALSHERGHVLQNAGSVEDRRALWERTALQTLPGMAGVVGRAFQQGLEADANRHACANSSPDVGYASFCP
jgi:hypothetical protein